MPTYDIKCEVCESTEEVRVSFEDQKAGVPIERLCPEPHEPAGVMKQVMPTHVGIAWNCSGGTRTFGGGKGVPRLDPTRNIGHNELTTQDLGLSQADAKTLGL